MSAPKLGEHYHCYCPCGGCENFEHCHKGECDAPKLECLCALHGDVFCNGCPVHDPPAPIMLRPNPLLPPMPGFAYSDAPLSLAEIERKWETNPHTFRSEVYPTLRPAPHYQALDSNGSPAPCDKGCDAWSHDDLCPVHGDQVKIWNNKIEAMIDWMEDNGIPLEPWQASAFRAIMRAQGNTS